jgi:hypothetical protein
MKESAVSNPETGVEPSFLPHPVMDRMLDALVALSAELWAERERRTVLERVLARRGLLEEAEIEAYRGTQGEEELRERERNAYVRRVFGSLGKL